MGLKHSAAAAAAPGLPSLIGGALRQLTGEGCVGLPLLGPKHRAGFSKRRRHTSHGEVETKPELEIRGKWFTRGVVEKTSRLG